MSYWVIDASIAVRTALALDEALERFWERVAREQVTPCAPRLWMSETTSAIRSLLAKKVITDEDAVRALHIIHSLRVEIINEDEEFCLRALELAGKLGQSKAYDAVYLALAEKLSADFWTADEHLVNRARDLHLAWVHGLGEVSI